MDINFIIYTAIKLNVRIMRIKMSSKSQIFDCITRLTTIQIIGTFKHY